jgi:hypothetical protein
MPAFASMAVILTVVAIIAFRLPYRRDRDADMGVRWGSP